MQIGFYHHNNTLYCDGVALRDIAASLPTPFYCYSRAQLLQNYNQLSQALQDAQIKDALICYSLKANGALAIIDTLARAGAGGDIVSAGELHRALAGGMTADKLVFSGVGKSASEIDAALNANIARFNVESFAEIDMIAARASAQNKTAHIAVRVNPDIRAGGHDKISTGKAGDKFGIDLSETARAYAQIAAHKSLCADGIDIHIGSQICELAPFDKAFACVAELLRELRAAGHDIKHLDLGGGLGIAYEARDTALDINAYAKLIARHFGASDCQILIEPGRFLVADAGILVSRVIHTKETSAKNFVIVDAAMSEFMRPALYDAHHHIAPIDIEDAPKNKSHKSYDTLYDIVGAICESGDVMGKARALPPLEAGDLLAIFHAGAYGAVLASNYNARARVDEVMVVNGAHHIICARESHDDMLARETIPTTTPSA